MKTVIVICMAVMTLYTIYTLGEKGRSVKIDGKEITRARKPLVYIIIALLNIAYLAACTFLALKVG